jgi:hypothetical protein
MTVEQAELLERRLRDAVGVAGVLAAGWEIFEFAEAAAALGAGQAADLYPAFTFARGSAVSGRNAIAIAPSLPAGIPVPQEGQAPREGEAEEIADAIAALAAALSERLLQAARLAADPDDQAACQDAARYAARIHELLAGDM